MWNQTIRDLGDEALVVLGDTGERCFEALLADLSGDRRSSFIEQNGDVRALGARCRTLGDASPEPRREAGHGSRVARGARGRHSQEDRVAVAVFPELLDSEGVPRCLALVPETLARAAEEVRLARLAREPERFVVHPREHEDTVRDGVLDDRGAKIRRHCAPARRARGARLEGRRAAQGSRGRSRRGELLVRLRGRRRRGGPSLLLLRR